MKASNFILPVDKPRSVIKWYFLWCAGPLTHSLVRCLWKAFAYLWGSAENGEKTVSLALWTFSCGCGHCLPSLSLCVWGVGTQRERTSLFTLCGFVHPEPLPAPCRLERVSLSKNWDCPAFHSLRRACSQESVSDRGKFKSYSLLFR